MPHQNTFAKQSPIPILGIVRVGRRSENATAEKTTIKYQNSGEVMHQDGPLQWNGKRKQLSSKLLKGSRTVPNQWDEFVH